MPEIGAVCVQYQVVGWCQPKAWACWYTSMQMVINYFRQGGHPRPAARLTDPSEDQETQQIFEADTGLPWRSVRRIAEKLGFHTLAACLTPGGMADLLVEHGPIVYAGQWPGSTSGHAVVITGIAGDLLHISDPLAGERTFDYNTFMGSYLLEQGDSPLVHAP